MRQGLLEAVLRFCYTGECLVARGSVLALLLLSDRFAVPALQAACEEARCVRKVDHAASGVIMDCIDLLLCTTSASSMHVQALQGRISSSWLHVSGRMHLPVR